MNFKRYDAYLIILLLLLFSVFILLKPTDTEKDNVIFRASSGDVIVDVEVARTQDELRAGLMYRTELREGSGMLFIFDQPVNLSFWMKNTLIPLDMIFISEDLRIIKIEKNVPPCRTSVCPSYGGVTGKYVVEVNAGFSDSAGIEEGDVVSLSIKS